MKIIALMDATIVLYHAVRKPVNVFCFAHLTNWASIQSGDFFYSVASIPCTLLNKFISFAVRYVINSNLNENLQQFINREIYANVRFF